MSQIIKMFSKYMLVVVIVTSIAIPFLNGRTAYAVEVYKGPCASGDGNAKLDVPFVKDGKTYDCVRDWGDGDTTPGGTSCPAGVAGWDTHFVGWACLVTDKVKVSTKDTEPPKVAKSDCKGTNIQAGAAEGSEEHCGILDLLMITINVLSALVGVIVVIMIIVGGIQYSAAGDDPQKVAAAKSKITNALLALFLFIFMYALLQWLVPGGIF